MRLIVLSLVFVLLSACAEQPNDDYQLTPDELQSAGSASMAQHENVITIYNSAEFVKAARKGSH